MPRSRHDRRAQLPHGVRGGRGGSISKASPPPSSKIAEMRGSFGEIGDMRLHVMAAITFVDELAETKKRLAAAEEELAAVRGPADDESSAGLEGQMADALNKTAERLERLAKTLSVPAPAGA